jgi:glycosyltransferase involved in cell wall biosynthesis
MLGRLHISVVNHTWYVRGQRTNPFSLALISKLKTADVIHCHQQHVVMSSLAAVLTRARGGRVFCTDLGGGGWDISAYVSTDRWFHGHLHISEYSRRIAGHDGAPWAHVVFGGVDAEKFSPDPGTPREERILFVGRLLPHKGVNDLIDALEPDMSLEVIGSAADEQYLSELETRSRGKKVLFRHDCDDAALIEAYRRSACVVLPSVYRDMYGNSTQVPELLGQTLLEGMACGLPGICTNVASLPEVVENGVTGLVVPPNDPQALRHALRWILEHREQRAAMGEIARRRMTERFSWEAVVNRCLEVYAA